MVSDSRLLIVFWHTVSLPHSYSMDFDSTGCLLAVGGTAKAIRVYDFEDQLRDSRKSSEKITNALLEIPAVSKLRLVHALFDKGMKILRFKGRHSYPVIQGIVLEKTILAEKIQFNQFQWVEMVPIRPNQSYIHWIRWNRHVVWRECVKRDQEIQRSQSKDLGCRPGNQWCHQVIRNLWRWWKGRSFLITSFFSIPHMSEHCRNTRVGMGGG